VAVDIKLVSAHLKSLKEARLVQSRREGKRIVYRLSGPDVAQLGVSLRRVAEEHLVELQMALQQMMAEPDRLAQVGRKELLAQAKRGEVVVLDVRPPEEFDTAHLPYARSVPLPELAQRLAELPQNVEIVAYCRGPFCLMSKEAVEYLNQEGFHAFRFEEALQRAHLIDDAVRQFLAADLHFAAAEALQVGQRGMGPDRDTVAQRERDRRGDGQADHREVRTELGRLTDGYEEDPDRGDEEDQEEGPYQLRDVSGDSAILH
jgi:rhodanese-related sulfurtransferase